LDTLNEEQLLDELARMQKSFDKKLNAYKDKVRAGLTEFAEEVEASKARGQTSWTTDSFSSLRPVAEVADEDQDEEPDDDQEEDYEDGDPDDVEGADSDEEVEGQDDEPEHDEEPEFDVNINEPVQSDSVKTLGAAAAPSAKVQHTKRIVTDEKQLVVKAPAAGDARRTAETKKLARKSDVQLVIMAQKEGLGAEVKLDAESRKDLVSALLDVKLRELEPPSVLHDVEQLVDKMLKSSMANYKEFHSSGVPQNVVRLGFDLKRIGNVVTDEQIAQVYLEIAKVLNKVNDQNAHQVFFVNQAEAALGKLYEQYKVLNEGEEVQLQAHFHAITVGKLPDGMEMRSDAYFKRRVLGARKFAELYDTFHVLHYAKRAVGIWHNKHPKVFGALTSPGTNQDRLRWKLLVADGQVPNDADMRRLKEFETEHSIDKKRQRK
jgi:ribosomal protein L7Ae-like RNA K-turn-binding protein